MIEFESFKAILGATLAGLSLFALIWAYYACKLFVKMIKRRYIDIIAVPVAAVLNANTRFTGVKHRIRDSITERLI